MGEDEAYEADFAETENT